MMSDYSAYMENAQTASRMDVKSLHFTILAKELHDLGITSDEGWKAYVIETFNSLCESIGVNSKVCTK